MINGYWIQQVEVLAGGKKFENYGDNSIDIEFNVPFSDSKEPDVSEIYIYNLTDETIADIKKDGYVYLNAGYRELNNVANILTGEIESIETKWEDLDKVTTIKVADGAKKWRTATLNKTYTENTKASQIMKDLSNTMSYEIVEINPKNDITYPLGKTIKGSCSETLKQLVKDTESKMFINKNRITIRDDDKGYNTGFVLNADSGLVDIPSENKNTSDDKLDDNNKTKKKKVNKKEQQTYTIKCLLNPRIETDSIIKVESKVLNGNFRVKSGKHTREFLTELEVVEA